MRCLIVACALMLACPTSSAAADRLVDTAGKRLQKPSLYIYTAADWCEPCKRLQADLDSDRNFRGALMERFILRVYDYDTHKSHAARAGVKALPSFFTADAHWEGYEEKEDLARRLNLDWRPAAPAAVPNVPAAPPISPPPVAAAPSIDVGQALDASYDRWVKHEQEMAALRKRLEASERREATLVEKARKAARDAAAAVTPSNDPADVNGGSGVGALIAWGLSQIGWAGGPLAGAATTLLVPMAYRLLTRRRPRRSTDRPRGPAVVAVDTPPDGGVVTRTEYVPYLDQTLQEAHAWAMREAVRKYPGAVNNLEFFQGLVEQYLSGVGRGKTV